MIDLKKRIYTRYVKWTSANNKSAAPARNITIGLRPARKLIACPSKDTSDYYGWVYDNYAGPYAKELFLHDMHASTCYVYNPILLGSISCSIKFNK